MGATKRQVASIEQMIGSEITRHTLVGIVDGKHHIACMTVDGPIMFTLRWYSEFGKWIVLSSNETSEASVEALRWN